MARPRELSLDTVEHLSRQGHSATEIVEITGASRASVYRALKKLQLVRPYRTHDMPWDVQPEHSHAKPTKYWRILSLASQEGDGDMEHLRTAFNWANRLIDAGLDIHYDPAHPEGFIEVPAPEDGGHVKKLRDAAISGQAGKTGR
jgi:hypothetical protein